MESSEPKELMKSMKLIDYIDFFDFIDYPLLCLLIFNTTPIAAIETASDVPP